jgi:hypothetical protein
MLGVLLLIAVAMYGALARIAEVLEEAVLRDWLAAFSGIVKHGENSNGRGHVRLICASTLAGGMNA